MGTRVKRQQLPASRQGSLCTRWSAKSAEIEPTPTTLQSQYILTSRQAAIKRQRIVIGAVAAALVIAVGLAIYAFIQKTLAEHQARIANSGRLAATALLQKDDQLELPLA